MKEKIYFPEDLEGTGLCVRVRDLEADYKIAVNALKKIVNSDMQPYDFIYTVLESLKEDSQ